MKLVRSISISILSVLLVSAVPLPAQDMPKDYQEVLTILGRSGDYKSKRPEGERAPKRFACSYLRRCDADALRVRRLGGV